MRYTFRAYERLKREQHIDTLFHTGKAFSVFPGKFIYNVVERGAEFSPVRVGFSVPKKKFRSSVHRHRIMRLMREAWRLHKHLLYPAIPSQSHLHLFLIFTDTAMPDYKKVQEMVVKGIERLIQVAASTEHA
ncbi:MAG TPA: ribonuclease P protein component [Flavipsychrobacter sp.]|nr:ribonuclease P protein component [Flavipsychrobacter sp.]